jgi:LysM repeat protein
MATSAYGSNIEHDSIRSEMRDDGLFVIHEVEEEETLYSISRRYRSSVKSIIQNNDITNNRIEIGQILNVAFEVERKQSVEDTIGSIPQGFHLIKEGETLYRISKIYGVRVKVLKKLNKLESNEISPGDYLQVSDIVETIQEEDNSIPDTVNQITGMEIPEDFERYIVQTTETLNSIARKKGVSIRELKEWNNLDSDYIKIGQTLIIKQLNKSTGSSDSTSVVTKMDEDGFDKVYEEGIASVISEISTSKYLALHRSLPIGTELAVRNLMNNLVVYVKVVGKLPDTGTNKNVLIRLSQPAFEKLGILDSKSRVEVSHFKK